jgi:hypothetical protein
MSTRGSATHRLVEPLVSLRETFQFSLRISGLIRLHDSIVQKRMIPMKQFHIQLRALPREIILISSDEETSPPVSRPNTPISNSPSPVKGIASSGSPMQARTMEDIGLAYCRTLSIYSQQRQSKPSTQAK